ncbi:hypothetical protein GCM10025760_34140 [Microbacterium yannicii]|uniref:Uncharacterized protein n=1 Tax=Microbacterium yannicii TaxID=671622 RepID=A0ABP9MSF5_9MICO
MKGHDVSEVRAARDLRRHGHMEADAPDLDDDRIRIDVHGGAAD